MGVVLGLLGLGAAPAQAYTQWQDVVIAPGGSDLTQPAKTVVTNPTFLPGVDKSTGPPGWPQTSSAPSPQSGLRKLMSGSRLLPLASKLLPWVAGISTALEVCNLLTDGCIIFAQDGDPPEASSSWTWTLAVGTTTTKIPGPVPPNTELTVPADTYYTQGLVTEREHPSDPEESCSGSTFPPPAEATGLLGTHVITQTNGCEVTYSAYSRDAGEGLDLTAGSPGTETEASGSIYCNGTTGSCSSSPDANWSEAMAQALQDENGAYGLTPEQADAVGEIIANEVEPADVTVPDCDGLLYPACEDLMEQLGLDPVRDDKYWGNAVVDEPAGAVLDVDLAGATVTPPVTVTITANPDDMPVVIPQPLPGETGEQYATRLATLGVESEIVVVPDHLIDQSAGPEEVVASQPAFGTRLNPNKPETWPEVEVGVNPPWVPPAGAGGADCAVPTGTVNFNPLLVDMGDVFPFALILWVDDIFGDWSVGGAAPQITIPFTQGDLVIDFGQFEPALAVIRPIVFTVSFLLLIWWLGTALLGLRGDEGEQS